MVFIITKIDNNSNEYTTYEDLKDKNVVKKVYINDENIIKIINYNFSSNNFHNKRDILNYLDDDVYIREYNEFDNILFDKLKFDNFYTIKYLLSKGAKPNPNNTPIIWAIKKGDLQTLSLIVNYSYACGELDIGFAMQYALFNDKKVIFEYLRQFSFDMSWNSDIYKTNNLLKKLNKKIDNLKHSEFIFSINKNGVKK